MRSEADIQSELRLVASRDYRAPLWRNNSGALQDAQGRHVRFGLGNESAALNRTWKSADLIGILPIVIQPHHVGQKLGVFLAVEAKKENWVFRQSDTHAVAQSNFISAVQSFGGRAGFAQSVYDLRRIIEG